MAHVPLRSLARARACAFDRRRILLGLELSIFAVAVPATATYLRGSVNLTVVELLIPAAALIAMLTMAGGGLSFLREATPGIKRADLIAVAALFGCASAALAAWMFIVAPQRLFAMPADQTSAWLTLIVLYPFTSALPQEIAFRTLFFHRYQPLLPSRMWPAIAINAAVFGFAHIIYQNPISVLLTCGLGVVLGYRYLRTRSLWLVWIEHTLYGELVFTVGLGHYFLLNPPH